MIYHTMHQVPAGEVVFLEPRDILARTLDTCMCASCRHYRNRRSNISKYISKGWATHQLINHPWPLEWEATS